MSDSVFICQICTFDQSRRMESVVLLLKRRAFSWKFGELFLENLPFCNCFWFCEFYEKYESLAVSLRRFCENENYMAIQEEIVWLISKSLNTKDVYVPWRQLKFSILWVSSFTTLSLIHILRIQKFTRQKQRIFNHMKMIIFRFFICYVLFD